MSKTKPTRVAKARIECFDRNWHHVALWASACGVQQTKLFAHPEVYGFIIERITISPKRTFTRLRLVHAYLLLACVSKRMRKLLEPHVAAMMLMTTP